jgi:hypothetical protein
MKFSDSTAILLKTLAFLNELNWSGETENILDLTSIKQLKGCRTTLVQDCLKFIQKLDVLAEAPEEKQKIYAFKKIQALTQALYHYKISCERYPRLKNFLNIIPDNTSGIVGFMIIASALTSIAFPPLAVLPLFIFSWVMLDLFFNNRDAAKNFNEILSILQNELRTIQEGDTLLNPTPNTPSAPITITAGTSHSPRMYGSVNQRNQDDINVNSSSISFTPSL